jgi:hypothetical protein
MDVDNRFGTHRPLPGRRGYGASASAGHDRQPCVDPPISHSKQAPPGATRRFLEAPIWLADAAGDSTHWIGLTRFGQNRVLGALTRMAMGMDRFWVGTAEAASIDVYGTDGMRHGSIDVAVEPRAPTHRNFERAIEVRLSVASSRAVRELQRAEFEAMPMPERVPPYSGILVDREELLWIVTSAPGDEQRQRAWSTVTPARSRP